MNTQIATLYNDALHSGQGNPNGQYYNMYEGENIMDLNSINFNDKLSALWIHPRINVTVTKDKNFTGQEYTFNGNSGQYITVDQLKGIGFQDNITSIRNTAVESLDEWTKKCCRNINSSTTSSDKCGKFWAQRSEDCGDLGCSAEELTHNSTCQTWCKKNPEMCDSVKLQFCRNNPSHNLCGCIMDTTMARTERQKYPQIPGNRQCWPQSDCQKTDLVDTFITTDLNKQSCAGDINAQIIDINNSGVMLGNSIDQSINSDYTIWIIIFIMILVISVIIISIIYFLD